MYTREILHICITKKITRIMFFFQENTKKTRLITFHLKKKKTNKFQNTNKIIKI